MAQTIFDTDFQPDDWVLLYEGSRFHWGGQVGDMTESDKEEYDVSTWFLHGVDRAVERGSLANLVYRTSSMVKAYAEGYDAAVNENR